MAENKPRPEYSEGKSTADQKKETLETRDVQGHEGLQRAKKPIIKLIPEAPKAGSLEMQKGLEPPKGESREETFLGIEGITVTPQKKIETASLKTRLEGDEAADVEEAYREMLEK